MPRSTYYFELNKVEKVNIRNAEISKKIKEIFEDSKCTYGYRRITEGLEIKYGVIFNHKKVKRIMSKYYIKPEYIKRIRPNGYKRIEENVKSNLVNRKFNVEEKNNESQIKQKEGISKWRTLHRDFCVISP